MKKMSQPTHEIPPPEIITEILYRLPAKSVGRFRCVSKGWLALLTDPQFIKTHTEKTLKQHHLIFQPKISYAYRFDCVRSVNLYSHPFHEIVVTTPAKFSLELDFIIDIRFSSSCDGLVLVRGDHDDFPYFMFSLVNPTTKETLQLPQDYFHKVRDGLKDVDDVGTAVLYGFGYDSVTDDYKVVTITYFNYYIFSDAEDADNVGDVYVYVHVYSLKSNTWRQVIESPYKFIESLDGVFVNGFIHWLVYKKDNLLEISAFSLADESFRDIPFPFPKSCNVLEGYSCKLVVLGGKLAIFLENKGEIWLMNEYGVIESWTKIPLHGINQIPLFKPEGVYTKPYVMDDNAIIVVANNDRMMVYEVDKGTFSETVCVWNPNNLYVFGSYVESLVSLKHNVTKQNSTNSDEEKEEDAEDKDVENEDLEGEDVAEDEGEENTYPERQTGKRTDICSSDVPSKHIRINSYLGSADIPGPSSRELLDPEVEGLCHRADTDLFNSLQSFEAIRQNMQATGHAVDTLSMDIKGNNVMILDLQSKVSQDYDSWKAKHQEEKLRADRLEEEVNHALSKQKFLTHRLEENEATIQSKLVEIKALVEKNQELLREVGLSILLMPNRDSESKAGIDGPGEEEGNSCSSEVVKLKITEVLTPIAAY